MNLNRKDIMEKKGNMDEYIDRLIRELPGVHTYEDGQSWHKGTYEGLAAFAKILIEYGIELGHTEADVESKMTSIYSKPLDEAARNYEAYYDACDETPYLYCMKGDMEQAYKAGAEWQRIHDIEGRGVDIESGKEIMKMEMMKDAINTRIVPTNLEETEFCLDDFDDVTTVTKMVNEGKVKMGDNVKLIITKSDE